MASKNQDPAFSINLCPGCLISARQVTWGIGGGGRGESVCGLQVGKVLDGSNGGIRVGGGGDRCVSNRNDISMESHMMNQIPHSPITIEIFQCVYYDFKITCCCTL